MDQNSFVDPFGGYGIPGDPMEAVLSLQTYDAFAVELSGKEGAVGTTTNSCTGGTTSGCTTNTCKDVATIECTTNSCSQS
jgi:hypothetical protein